MLSFVYSSIKSVNTTNIKSAVYKRCETFTGEDSYLVFTATTSCSLVSPYQTTRRCNPETIMTIFDGSQTPAELTKNNKQSNECLYMTYRTHYTYYMWQMNIQRAVVLVDDIKLVTLLEYVTLWKRGGGSTLQSAVFTVARSTICFNVQQTRNLTVR
jgi:hypothetical protein